MTRKDKKNKDRISITVIGLIIYSVLLLAVMCGTYVGVKAILRNYDAKVAKANEQQAATEEEIAESTPSPTAEPTAEPTPEPEEEVIDISPGAHDMDISKFMNEETGLVDYSKILFEPAKRNTSLKWNDTVFSKIENVNEPANSPVNSFVFKRVRTTLSDNREAEYKVYTNPDNSYIEKVTEVTEANGYYEVIDYYYDQGNVNYIAASKMIIEKPISPASPEIESRYYFRNDVMVRFIFCSEGRATEYTVGDLGNYSEGTVDQYNYLEKDMINRSYMVYNLAKSLKETELIYGYVLDEFSMPIEDAQITVTAESDSKTVATGSTDGDGFYKLSIPCEPSEKYTVTANKDTLNGLSVYGITSLPGAGKYAVDPMYLSYQANGAVYNVQIMVRNAEDANVGLSGATIKLRRGINDLTGEVIAAGELDDTGMVLVPMTSGCYTAEVEKGGYETTYFTVNVRADHQAAIGFAVPDVPEDTYKVVLSWENPLDLDLKAVSSGRARILKSGTDSLGTIMAEVVTIDNAKTDDFRVFVGDYGSIATRDALSYNMTSSKAMVTVYGSEGKISSHHVPVASAGVVWEAVEIRNKRVLPVNKYYYAIEQDDLWIQKNS